MNEGGFTVSVFNACATFYLWLGRTVESRYSRLCCQSRWTTCFWSSSAASKIAATFFTFLQSIIGSK